MIKLSGLVVRQLATGKFAIGSIVTRHGFLARDEVRYDTREGAEKQLAAEASK